MAAIRINAPAEEELKSSTKKGGKIK